MRDTIVDSEVIKRGVQLACRAPSLHNSQPWRWVLDEHTLHLFIDPSRAPTKTDTSGREALFGCGAALDHFRVAMAAAGWQAHVDRFPNPNNLHHLASIDFSPMEFVTDGHRLRADAILRRRTDRLPFQPPPDWDSVEETMRHSVAADDIRLDVVPDELRPELAELSQLTETLRLYDSSYHAELREWTPDFQASIGIPKTSLVSAAESERVDVGRNFPVTHNPERRSNVHEDHSKILVLSTLDDTHDVMLRCGEMLSAVLLDATMAGLATCTLSHITELAESRQVLTTLIGQTATPQLLVRVGRAPSIEENPPPTPRRPIEDVFQVWHGPHE
ncbi:Acg family FMN-binding oxidoreductase [Mycolicibacterium sp. 120270]|uniref:Acg family FMN-binding oxidoreductase n=1 Tax=Mycolicibacterium sp. 120270 TaxID=3090600 RepID=UPI00299EB626|nr:NAD(P)H nitroreductase [Mycolicibacterium sp. 120270]MDX1885999.1 NAD(P)H nitroreductase [Mycolicibacterium sp. 120270]